MKDPLIQMRAKGNRFGVWGKMKVETTPSTHQEHWKTREKMTEERTKKKQEELTDHGHQNTSTGIK
jgi:hypothetical protein